MRVLASSNHQMSSYFGPMAKQNKLVRNILCYPLLMLSLFYTVPSAAATSFCSSKSCSRSDMVAQLGLTGLELRNAVLMVTVKEGLRAQGLVSSMDTSSLDQRAKSAWYDCVELYEDTVLLLKQSAESNSPADSQTWLSAAMTNQETCKDGFKDLNVANNLESRFPDVLGNFSKLLGLSLAINKETYSRTPPPPSRIPANLVRGRRLLGNNGDGAGFPSWLTAGDRKLLQTTKAPAADIVVAKDGTGDYKTIAEAVAASSGRSGGKRFVIYVKAGVYAENVVVKRSMKNLMMVGDGIDATIVTGNKNAEGGSTTFRSATFAVTGGGFIARGITFENTAGPSKHQAVALRSGADFSVFYGCSFKGYQDTLYVYAQRQFYRDCDIHGTVDFIFGNAVVVFQNCNLYIRKPMGSQFTTVTAQSRTDPNQNTGIIIHNSRVTASSEMKSVQGSYNNYLGRPWKQYSRTVFMKTSLDSLINPKGWLPWAGSFALSTLYYGEYMNTGAGAGTGGRVTWKGYHTIMSTQEAETFTVGKFLVGDAWIPSTGVPYSTSL